MLHLCGLNDRYFIFPAAGDEYFVDEVHKHGSKSPFAGIQKDSLARIQMFTCMAPEVANMASEVH